MQFMCEEHLLHTVPLLRLGVRALPPSAFPSEVVAPLVGRVTPENGILDNLSTTFSAAALEAAINGYPYTFLVVAQSASIILSTRLSSTMPPGSRPSDP